MLKSSRIPPHAKLVFKGIIFDVYQWQQEMFDGSIETFEFIKRCNSAQIIAAVGDKIIILDQEQPAKGAFISLPAGRCDNDDDPLKEAKRELLEETGYESNDWIHWRETKAKGSIDWTTHTYIARDCKYKQPQNLDNGEKISVRLISFDEFLMLADNENFRDKNMIEPMLRARLDPKTKQELRDLIFNKENR